ncbi:uncharacterized protein LOC116252062 isoform X2 [Nymphaea colorata]|uniref:uncharacterized protein LOC116252062 isoform X2 n=1 Tax=Nymphaea colorata TaxID=210225 RepID=UPI00129DCD88|nr:uncharacterized protein LOC116252062 isoform X2 [Nymphaea colorata]
MKSPAAPSDAKRLRISTRSLSVSRPGSHEKLLLLHRLRQNLLYLKLRSLLPKPSNLHQPNMDEIPQNDGSDDDESLDRSVEVADSVGSTGEGDAGDANINDQAKGHGHEDESKQKKFKPSIKLRKSDGTLLISLVVLKKVALASRLFALLEKESLDLVFQHQYCTETKACYTVQVRVPDEVDEEALKEKIGAWADGKKY